MEARTRYMVGLSAKLPFGEMEVQREQNKSLGARLVNLLVTLVIAYLLALVAIRLFESHLIFFPNYPGRLEGDWHPRNLPVEDVWLNSSDGTRLHAWWIPNDHAKFTFLAFHGNASNIANRAEVYEFLRDTPANVFALEYRGYGKSEGKPSEAGIYRDADAAYQYLVDTEAIPPKSIVSFGQSLGTAVAANLAASREVGAVVLEAPFPSASVLARKLFWFFPGIELFVRGQLNTAARLNETSAPILIVHCTEDRVIPFQFGQAVYSSAPSHKRFLQIEGMCHEEPSLIAPAKYHAALQDFLQAIEPSSNSSVPGS
jgi:fermentation-respiration switch protein FrsA (DUF1100 family)